MRAVVAESRRRPDTVAVVTPPAGPTRPAQKVPPKGPIPRTCNATNAPRAKYTGGSPVYDGLVVNVDVRVVQPGGPFTAVDLTLASEWQYYIKKTGTGLGDTQGGGTIPPPCILRVHLGVDAGDNWKFYAGPFPQGDSRNALTVTDSGGASQTVGRFWLPNYLSAFDDLATRIATSAKTSSVAFGGADVSNGVEGLSHVREMAMHVATTTYVEMCQRANGDANNRQAFITAGLNDGTDNLANSLDLAAILYITQAKWVSYGFLTTACTFRFNPYQQWKTHNNDGLTDGGKVTDPIDQTAAGLLIPTIAGNMTSRAGIGNNSGRVPFFFIGQPYPAVFQAMFDAQALGVRQRQTFQTATYSAIADALNWRNTTKPKPSDYTIPPNHSNYDALIYTLKVMFGEITPASDTYGFYHAGAVDITTAAAATYVELPDGSLGVAGDGSGPLTDADIAHFKTLGQANFTD